MRGRAFRPTPGPDLETRIHATTQNTRITGQVAHAIRTELTTAEGYKPQMNGVLGGCDQL